jgi:DNA polymerase elongation subunit (family B)
MIFQIVDWNYFHEEDDDGIKQYKIRLFGRTKENKTIYVCVENFNPYFYIEIDKTMRKEKIEQLINDVKKKVYPKENVDGLLKYELEEHHNLYGFTNSAKFPFLKLIFTSFDAFRSYERVFNKPIRNKKYRLFESNIEPFLRCMHIQNLDAVGWVEIKDDKYDNLDKNITCCDINIATDYRNLLRYEERIIMPLVIASFDIECVSEDGSFPQPERENDKIIQIGTTFSKFGETDCYYKHIVTLGKCNKLEGVDIESYLTEKEMLLAWTELLRRTNPDVITGYNIFGFDFEYMMKRAEKLGISRKFSRLSRITGEECKWQEKKLASSALGDNILKYYDMTGRIIIDLMKVAQRDFKLASYKLDYVASSFIKEGIQKLELDNKHNRTTIHTKSTYGVVVDQFITIFYNDSITDNKHMDGKKFKILELESNKLVVDGLIEDDIMSMGYKVFWCQAKDDISPQDIFDYQKKNDLTEKCKYRTIIAKYCIQDNVLCNKLMAKLQVLTNNIGMANVCHVPLSYLFMRGQGVKIFSLVSRRCRLENHLIPVLKKPKKEEDSKNKNVFDMKDGKLLDNFVDELNNKENDFEEEDEDNKYEGAIVFPPKKGVYFEPIPVLDYNSLYPNSMVQRNLSHECNILDNTFDEKYGYLKSHKYHEIVYNTTYVFDEIYKELKDDNVYIDFFRLILSTFIPKIKVDYSQLLDEDELSMDSSSIGSKNKNKNKTNTIIVKYNSEGTAQWYARMGGSGTDNPNTYNSLACDQSNNVCIHMFYANAPLYIYNANQTLYTTLYNIANSDLENCFQLAHKDTIVALDDTMFTKKWEQHYTVGPTKVWTEYLQENKIIECSNRTSICSRNCRFIWEKINHI